MGFHSEVLFSPREIFRGLDHKKQLGGVRDFYSAKHGTLGNFQSHPDFGTGIFVPIDIPFVISITRDFGDYLSSFSEPIIIVLVQIPKSYR